MSAMKRALTLALAGAAATVAVLTSPALGQEAISSLKGHDGNAPVDFAADRIEVQDRADRAVVSGNVLVRQAELTLRAARVTFAYTDTSGIKIDRVDASGGVTVTSPSETARGRYAIYDIDDRLITVIGDVTLVRGDSHVNGGRLVIDLATGRAVMDGGAGGTAPGTTTSGGRVTGTFTVPQRND